MKRSILAAAVLLSLTSAAFAQAKGDWATPERAVATYLRALERGDADLAARSVVDDGAKWAAAAARHEKALRDLAATVAGVYDADVVTREFSGLTDAVAAMEARQKGLRKAEAAATGDAATVTLTTPEGTPGEAFTLKKVDGQWKVVAKGENREQLESHRETLTALNNRVKTGVVSSRDASKALGEMWKKEGKEWSITEPPPPPTTTVAATKPAEPVVVPATGKWQADWSTPANAVMTFYRSVAEGKTGIMRRTAVFEDTALGDSVEAHTKLVAALRDLVEGLSKKSDAAAIDKAFNKQIAILKAADDMVATAATRSKDLAIAGDEGDAPANLPVPGGDRGVVAKLKKAGNEWRVVITRGSHAADPDRTAKLRKAWEKDLEVYTVLASKARAGLYKDAAEALKAWQEMTGQTPEPTPGRRRTPIRN